MKPLNTSELALFVKRFSSFKDAEFRSLEMLSPTQVKITFAVQDSARAHDWISLALEFSGIEDAKLIQENQISLVDMSDGINILENNGSFAFCIGECYNLASIKSSICYIIATSLKYQEGQF